MFKRLKAFLDPPIFEDDNLTRSANLLNTILVSFTLMALAGAPIFYATDYLAAPELYQFEPRALYAAIATITLNIILLYVMHQGRVKEAGFIWTLFLFALITTLMIQENGVHNPFVAIYIVLIMLSGLLLGQFAVLLFSFLSVAATFAMVYLDLNDLLMIPHAPASFRDWVLYLFSAVLATFLLRFALQSLNEALIGFQQKNKELEQLSASLEERVKARTRALAASGEVSRRISTILDLDQLVAEVVERVQATFDYYHVHIYLIDSASQKLTMVGGTGNAGTVMLASGHALSMGQGLVGKAAEINEPILVGDVRKEPTWLPNELLPETKSETAVPISLGDQVLGVLDVQHNQMNGLTEDDTQLLQTIANQVAIALRNARLYEQAQQKADQEALINMIGQKIENAATVDNVLDIAARELRQSLGVQRTIVELGSRPQTSNV
jgi:putative methionine-R-sulfoxide reductase with GAF domain